MHIKESMCGGNKVRGKEALWTDGWIVYATQSRSESSPWNILPVHFANTSLLHKVLLKLGVIIARLINKKYPSHPEIHFKSLLKMYSSH